MESKKTQFITIVLLAGVLLVGVIALNSCKKSEPAAIAQTTCPVMDGAINKDLFTEYKGKKVYFCCPGCKEKFEAKPEDYIAKLPQFKD
jgi:YHS domain-containing protein